MQTTTRRRFLAYLAASPVFSAAGNPLRIDADASKDGFLIDSPEAALDVFDFQAAARRRLPPAHYGYIATGTDGDETLRANREAFDELYLRPVRMVDTSRIDLSCELLGTALASPVVLAPVSSQQAFHPEAEVATARAARAGGHLQVLSNLTNRSVDEVTAARGAPVWSQLYPPVDWTGTRKILERAERAGSPAVVLTVDLNGGSNRLSLERYARTDDRDCAACHRGHPDAFFDRRPWYRDTGVSLADFMGAAAMTWDYVARLQDETSMQVIVKGIVTAEDAEACLRHGVDAVWVSNHGGRAEASGRGAIDSLPEVAAAVDGRVPVIFDSGLRRGTDIFKALALGADAVAIGRPYAWGLGAFGQAGVEKVLEMLDAELAMVMRQMGTPALADISGRHVGYHGRRDRG